MEQVRVLIFGTEAALQTPRARDLVARLNNAGNTAVVEAHTPSDLQNHPEFSKGFAWAVLVVRGLLPPPLAVWHSLFAEITEKPHFAALVERALPSQVMEEFHPDPVLLPLDSVQVLVDRIEGSTHRDNSHLTQSNFVLPGFRGAANAPKAPPGNREPTLSASHVDEQHELPEIPADVASLPLETHEDMLAVSAELAPESEPQNETRVLGSDLPGLDSEVAEAPENATRVILPPPPKGMSRIFDMNGAQALSSATDMNSIEAAPPPADGSVEEDPFAIPQDVIGESMLSSMQNSDDDVFAISASEEDALQDPFAAPSENADPAEMESVAGPQDISNIAALLGGSEELIGGENGGNATRILPPSPVGLDEPAASEDVSFAIPPDPQWSSGFSGPASKDGTTVSRPLPMPKALVDDPSMPAAAFASDADTQAPKIEELFNADSATMPSAGIASMEVDTLRRYAALKEREAREREATIDVLNKQLNQLREKLSRSENERRRLLVTLEEQKSNLRSLEDVRDQHQHHTAKLQQGHQEELRAIQLRLDNAQFQAGRSEKKLEEFRERVRSDILKIRMRERELANKLELQKRDAEALLQAKDERLLQQKREIDRLEFELENLKERMLEETQRAEERAAKLTRAIRSLKMAQGMLSGIEEEVLPNIDIDNDDEGDAA